MTPPSVPPPPHYVAFRYVLLVLVIAVLAATVWLVMDPVVLAAITEFLGVTS